MQFCIFATAVVSSQGFAQRLFLMVLALSKNQLRSETDDQLFYTTLLCKIVRGVYT